jgi:hypothetical protein
MKYPGLPGRDTSRQPTKTGTDVIPPAGKDRVKIKQSGDALRKECFFES